MDKESIIELQKIDCNCNDCKFMQRNTSRFDKSVELHHKWQLDQFNSKKDKLIEKANWYEQNGEIEKGQKLHKEANKMKFMFSKGECLINYGDCQKFEKSVSFIPNTCQIETQDCFEHRRK